MELLLEEWGLAKFIAGCRISGATLVCMVLLRFRQLPRVI